MNAIAIDGSDEESFRRSIEMMLRRGEFDRAAMRLRALLAPHVGDGKILPLQFLRISSDNLRITGWERLSESLAQHDRPDHPITALSICFGAPAEDAPTAFLELPCFETAYFSDDSFTFSQSTRDDLLDGYSTYGCAWTGDGEASDGAISIVGFDDLHAALVRLEARLLDSAEPSVEEIRAGSLGACLLSVLLFQVLRDTIARKGLPRPICVMAGNNGVYPYFDAPVTGIEQSRSGGSLDQDDGELDEAREGAGGSTRYASLLMSSIPRAKKRAVLVLDETGDEMAVRIANLRGLPREEAKPARSNVMESLAALSRHFPAAPEEPTVPTIPELQSGPAELLSSAPDAPEPLPPEPLAFDPPVLEHPASAHGLLKTKPGREARRGDAFGIMPGFDLLDLHQPDLPDLPDQPSIRFEPDIADLAEPQGAMIETVAPPAIAIEPAKFSWPPELAWYEDEDAATLQTEPAPAELSDAPEALAPPQHNGTRLAILAGFRERLRALIGRWRGQVWH